MRFGQHFLTQPQTAERIVESAELQPGEVVVEVGPGLGALTRFILAQARVSHLVELDRDLAAHLRAALASTGSQVFIHQRDILTFDFKELSEREQERLVVLGNLPYNITSPLIFHLLESLPAVGRAVFMVQREVGERLAAQPGTKDYGVLSVLLGVHGRVSRLFTVGPGQFHPPPKVDSLVIRIDFPAPSVPLVPPFAAFRALVNTAFQKRRKTLWNSLKSTYGRDPAVLESALRACGVDPQRRPETLTPEEYLGIAAKLHDLDKA
jgi:16S rRNA (adenine1518-N6/adenine1519-N6)-dimethyltransferase